ncbi:hypothetical protein ACFV2V_04795 [Streptomyces sp. NPDC059698]|uniref:hypothetical protein n=1 Tax=unclassified Streptomyces TaxID=2593676 RepID=UPI0030834329
MRYGQASWRSGARSWGPWSRISSSGWPPRAPNGSRARRRCGRNAPPPTARSPRRRRSTGTGRRAAGTAGGRGGGAEAFVEARDEAHRLRTAARQTLYRVKLLTDDPEAVRAAELAYERVRDISTARDQEGHDALHVGAGEAIEAFITRAAPLTR